MRYFAVALVVALLTALPSPSSAQSKSWGENPEDQSGEAHEQVWFVPRLVGALSVDGALRYGFPIGPSVGFGANWEISAGWRHFFDGHSRGSLRAYGLYGRGLFLGPEETAPLRLGGGVALLGRAISRDWVFGSLGLKVEASLLRGTPPTDPFRPAPEMTTGYQLGVGAESTFGSLFLLNPYMFAETGASASVSHLRLGTATGWEVWVTWTLRFEWAIRRVDSSAP